MGIVEATLCGDENEIKKVCAEHGFDISRFKIVHEPVDTKAAAKAVQMVRDCDKAKETGLTPVFVSENGVEVTAFAEADMVLVRSEERRVGKECRSRWSPYH